MILFRYLLWRFCGTFLYLTGVFTLVLYLVQSFRFFKYIIQRQIDVGEFFSFTALLFPHVLSYLIPFTFALSCAYVYHGMAQNRELPVLRSLGFSRHFLLRPALIMGIATMMLQVGLHDISPASFRIFLKKEADFVARINFKILKPQQFNTLNDHVVYFAAHQDQTVRDVFLYRQHKQKQQFIAASEGTLKDIGDDIKVLELRKGCQLQYDENSKNVMKLSFDAMQINLGKWDRKKLNIRDILLGQRLRQLLLSHDDMSRGEAYIRIAKTLLPIALVFVINFFVFDLGSYLAGGLVACLVAFTLLLVIRTMPHAPIAFLIYGTCAALAITALTYLRKR